MRTYKDVLEDGIQLLETAAIEEARLDAWLLLEYTADITRAWYYAHMDDGLDAKTEERYRTLCTKRAQHIPLQHITGRAYFMGYEFCVDERVLVPRQDTEVLVETALSMMKPGCRLLDMCTGSGCIVLSLAKLGTVTWGIGADISEEALKVAERNRENLGLSQVKLVHSDLFGSVEGVFDMIVSNPPYIPTDDIEDLMREVKDHEPHLALDGSRDGLLFYRKLAEESGRYLVPGGSLLFEIGYDQGKAVSQLLDQAGFKDIHVKKDLAGLDRVVYAVKAAEDGGK